MRAPRVRAESRDSRNIIADPSPSTNPSLSLSKGRDALSGSSLRLERALMEEKPATPILQTGASVPPQTAISDCPYRIESYARPILCEPVAQAETAQKLAPLNPYLIEICPAGISGINIGMKNGFTPRDPCSCSETDCS